MFPPMLNQTILPVWEYVNSMYVVVFRFELISVDVLHLIAPKIFCLCYYLLNLKKVNRKVQEGPQAEAAANPRHQEEEKKWHRLMCA